jgi:hypothetical protein
MQASSARASVECRESVERSPKCTASPQSWVALSDSITPLILARTASGISDRAAELMAATGYDRNLVRIGKERVEGVSRPSSHLSPLLARLSSRMS